MKNISPLLFFLSLLCTSLLWSARSYAQPRAEVQDVSRDIWLCPQASVPPSPLNRAVDFMELFRPDAPWKEAASHVRVFKLYNGFVNHASQEQVDTIVRDLNRRGIAIALEMGVMDVNYKDPVPPCGGFGLVEGYGTPAIAAAISAKIKHAGGEIRYLCMDEPLYYGHYFTSRPGVAQPGCHSPISQIVELSMPTLKTFIQEFPNIVIGDVEPTVIAAFAGWQGDLETYMDEFRKATGRRMAFLHLDIPWANHKPSVEPNDALAVYKEADNLKSKHVLDKIGIIYDGTPLDTTDASWMEDARQHLVRLTEALKLYPDQMIFQSWMPHPTHALPAGNPNALTNIVNFYVRRYLAPGDNQDNRQVWLSGIDPVVAADRQRIGMTTGPGNDFMDLFHPNAPWEKAASAIQIFKVSTQFLQRSTDEQLAAVINDLHRRHISLALAAEIMATSRECGNGVPGYTTKAVIQMVADRVSRMGGTIDFVAFDSPMAFGHFNILQKSNACVFSIEDLVRNIAPQVQLLKSAFPGVVFGDVEPVNNHTVGWISDYLEFARQFQQQTKERLSFLQADLIWYDNWQPQLVEWRKQLHNAGIAYGVIFDGSAIDKSDLEWTNHAIERYRTVMNNPETRPTEVVFQTWHSFPTRFLPESKNGTLTSVVVQTVGAR